ncbi:hypothetical protein MMC25_000016 [Agyrium rufum]|nr:hypothetical protein [Agyrium rufum]
MGRRKIEIKAIKDDRNRSVTFLKRKGGLFKKAHELSVLCSVDVAVIIFGHNKKLYEFASGNIDETISKFHFYQQSGGPHEHKGPTDYLDRGDGGDDDDEDGATPPPEELAREANVPQHLHNTPSFQHIKHAPSASPPISNGSVPPYIQRQHTPQPHMGSRPGSRNDFHRPPSSLMHQHPQHQQQVSHAPQTQNGYAYVPTPPMYHPQPQPHGLPSHPQHLVPQPSPNPYQQYGPPHPNQMQHPQHPQQPQLQLPSSQQQYLQDQRRSSMPPAFPQQEQTQQHPPQISRQTPSPPQSEMQHHTAGLQPEQPKPLPAKSRSIFTPIDDSRSMLAQHWGMGPSTSDSRNDNTLRVEKDNRSQSVDVSSLNRNNISHNMNHNNFNNPFINVQPIQTPNRAMPIPQPQRTETLTSMTPADGKRPRLKVQIPSEQSDDGGSATANSSPAGTAAGGTPAGKASTDGSRSSAVVLPPPSPSASAILSAGASGPPNPFARPAPPMTSNNPNNSNSRENSGSSNNGTSGVNIQAYDRNNNIETPISALPSRFVADGLLPSPSSFYPEWGFGRNSGDGNLLPSPLNFTQTPIAERLVSAVGGGGSGLSNGSSSGRGIAGLMGGAVSGEGGGVGGAGGERSILGKEEDGGDRKRKSPESDERLESGAVVGKRMKIEM